MTDYQNLLHAIENYYGHSSDVWLNFAQYNDVTSAYMASQMANIPDVTTIVNSSGEVLGYQYTGVSSPSIATSVTEPLSQTFNSNIGNSVTGMGKNLPATTTGTTTTALTKVKVPVNTTVTSGGRIAAMKSGLSTAGNFTMNTVLPAIAATAAGISLGKWVDQTLYNLAPDFWDANNMSSLNPETWGRITSGDDSVAARLFNMVFGINPETQETQAYIDQNALAYLAAYMATMGVFADPLDANGTITYNGSDLYTDPDNNITPPFAIKKLHADFSTNENANYPFNYIDPVQGAWTNQHSSIWYDGYSNYTMPFFRTRSRSEVGEDIPTHIPLDIYVMYGDYEDGGRCICYGYHSDDYRFLDLLSEPTSLQGYQMISNLWNTNGWLFFKLTGGYWHIQYANDANLPPSTNNYDFVWNGSLESNLMHNFIVSLYHGDIDVPSGVEGMPNQPDADVFDPTGISDLSDISEVLAALQSQYPDLFSGAVTNNVLQPDGSTKNIIYVPIGFPQIDPDRPTEPIATIATQEFTNYDPEEEPEIADLIALLIQGINNPDPDDPTIEDDPIDDPNPPDTDDGETPPYVPPVGSVSALYAVYNPTQAQVDSFGSWLWNNNIFEQIKQLFNDPMQSIISLHKIFGTPSTGSNQNIYVGYLDSGIPAATVSNQYTSVDCGTILLQEYFGNVLDYHNTSVELYLPFVGIVPLSVADVMRASLHVVYHIDVLTGECLVEVNVIRDLMGGVLYQFAGNCAVHYPISSGSYMGIIQGLLTVGAGVAGTVATGGVAAPAVIGAGSAILRTHTDVARSGGFSANAGAMGIKKPYLIISRPQTALPTNYLEFEGIGSNMNVKLSSCSGYVTVKECQLSNILATDNEKKEIETLLKGGVII